MSFYNTITNIAQDVINSQSQILHGTVTSYYGGAVTVETEEGLLESIKCIGIPEIRCRCLLIPVNDEYTCIPYETTGGGGDLSDYYTKSEINNILSSYVTINFANSHYALAVHNHTWNDIQNKPTSFPPSSHTHEWNDIEDKPSAFPPSSHNHDERYYTETEIDNALNEKQETLVSGTNIKTINNETLLGSGNINTPSQNVFYGSCSTSASTQTKVITVTDWNFITGNILFVKFDNANSYNGTAQISIDGTVKDIATVGTTKTSRYYWKAGELIGFVYDGTNMLMLEQGTATTTYYGVTKLSSSTSSTSTSLAATPSAVKSAYDLAKGKADEIHNHVVSDITDFPTIPSKTSDLLNDGADGSDTYVESADLSSVAISGSYNDLNNIPSDFPPSTHTHDDRYYTEREIDAALNNKQNSLISGTNIKTINNESILGSGNIVIESIDSIDDTISNVSTNPVQNKKIYEFEEEILAEIGDKFSTTGGVTPISNDWLDTIYPVGSIYMSVNTANPGTLIGGTWEKIEDKFLLASGNSYTSGSTGGEAEHTLTIDEIPSHSHTITEIYHNQNSGTITSNRTTWASQCGQRVVASNTGGGQAHNNMPPYLVVNVWYRIR